MLKWFKFVFGFQESIDNVYNNIEVLNKSGDENVYLRSKANNRTFLAGICKCVSHQSFKDTNINRGNGCFNIIHVVDRKSEKFKLADVMQSQSLPENDGATYLAASNLHCLETTGPYDISKFPITRYPHDMTQGPYCAFAAAASLMYRYYFIPIDGQIGQLGPNKINLLRKTPINVVNGFAIINENDVHMLKSFNFEDPDIFEVMSHENCQVTTLRDGSAFKYNENINQTTNHIYAALFDFGHYVFSCDFTRQIARILMKNILELTIKQAYLNSIKYSNKVGCRKLYLTPIGCGVFRNRMSDFIDVLCDCSELIIKSGLEVYLVLFQGGVIDTKLQQLVLATNGSVINT